MDRSWRRGFLGGFAALALAVGGQVAVSALSTPEQCSVADEQPLTSAIVHKLAERQSGLTQRVALAVLGAMLMHTCS